MKLDILDSFDKLESKILPIDLPYLLVNDQHKNSAHQKKKQWAVNPLLYLSIKWLSISAVAQLLLHCQIKEREYTCHDYNPLYLQLWWLTDCDSKDR